jgi:hypothetical protein
MLTVGQQLWFVPSQRRCGSAEYVTVEKIGRKWATISNGYRIDLETLTADGGQYMSPGACWTTKEEWEAATERHQAWFNFRAAAGVQYQPPDGFTTEEINVLLARLNKSR